MHRGVVGGLLVSLLAGPALRAEHLPLKLYTAADGLVGDFVQALAEDPRGFLWIGTSTGVSRFDGHAFASYGTEDGLPHPSANVLRTSSDGTIWVGTSQGLAYSASEPIAGRPLFESLKLGDAAANHVNSLELGPAGRLWVGTSGGLLSVEPSGRGFRVRRVPLGPTQPPGHPGHLEVYSLLAERNGRLWVGTSQGLIERFPDGRFVRHRLWPDAGGEDPVLALALETRKDFTLLWVAHQRGVFAAPLAAASVPGGPTWLARAGSAPEVRSRQPSWRSPASEHEIRLFSIGLAVAKGNCSGGIALGKDGTAWFTTSGGLLALSEERWRLYSVEHGFPERSLSPLLADRSGNLWVGAETRGLLRLAAGGFVSFGPADGLSNRRIANIFEDRAGELVVLASDEASRRIYVFADGRFEEVTPPAFLHLAKPGWGWSQTVWQDRRGEWWLPTGEGLLHFPAGDIRSLRTAKPLRTYTPRDGLPSPEVFRLYEDRRGDLWLSLLATPQTLVRLHRSTGELEAYTPFPPPFATAPTAFAEDAAGNLWIGFYAGGLARWNETEGLRIFPPGPDLPSGFVYDLLLDRRGSLWAAMSNGAVRIDRPGAPAPRFARFAPAGGLGRDSLRALAEDEKGRIYLGSDRGIDRLDRVTGNLESFTTGDGLANSNVRILFPDRLRRLWVGTLLGISRLDPQTDGTDVPIPVVISGIAVAGVPQSIPALPASRLAGFVLQPGGDRIQIDFAGVRLAPGAALRYQTRLGRLAPEWSPPSTNRSILLAGLPPGPHRLEVRAVTGPAQPGGEVAEVAFEVLPPLWRRAWFLATVGLALAVAVWAGHRYRIGRLLAVERVRTRIASDLHDEVGASLSRIGILAEVGKLRLDGDETTGAAEAGGLLSEIGETSRELSEEMSDIVWSLDPRRDDLPSLVARLRRFASDVLEAQGVHLEFVAPEAQAAQRLSTGDRRELYLLLKEAIHNAAKHSRAGRVVVALEVRGHVLHARVEDDGVGLEYPPEGGGHGLGSMKRRAAQLGGSLAIDSAPGKGTCLRVEAPLSAWRRFRFRRSA